MMLIVLRGLSANFDDLGQKWKAQAMRIITKRFEELLGDKCTAETPMNIETLEKELDKAKNLLKKSLIEIEYAAYAYDCETEEEIREFLRR